MTSRFSSSVGRARMVIGALAALGVVAWSGCGSDDGRYYCDTGGCFQCDGYGCSRVTAPAHPTCTSNASCGGGAICTTAGCTQACTSDASCPKGETCQHGFCSPPGTDPGTPHECSMPSDCGSGKTCAGGTCITVDGGSFDSGSPAPPPATLCKYSSECADGKICADGQCLTSCATAPCTSGFTCDKSVCKPLPPSSSDAGTTACTGDAQCGAGMYCSQGSCVVDTRPKPNCTTDDQCGGTAATPKKCLGGYCKYTCNGDSYCRTIDSRIGVCAKDGVCRSATEASATCFGPSDCATGQSCIDNQCR